MRFQLRNHDSCCKLPARCREARRPLSVPIPKPPEPQRYSSYLTCEPELRSRIDCAASSTTAPPACAPPPLWQSRFPDGISTVATCAPTPDRVVPPSVRLPPAASASSNCPAC